MHPYQMFPNIDLALLDEASLADLQALSAEAIGWLPLGQCAYLHHGDVDESQTVIQVVGIPDVQMAGMNVLLLA